MNSNPWAQAWRRIRVLLGADIKRDERGVAMLVVLISSALFTAYTTEFAYNTRITVQIAGNLQQDVQAYYHARSAIEIARMVIRSQNLVGQLMGGMGGNMELWKYSCKFAEIYNSGKIDFFGLEIADLSDQEGIGVKKGGFECQVEAEDGRVNVNDVDSPGGKQRIFNALFQYVRGPDADPGRYSKKDREQAEVLLNIMDWADEDENGTDLDPNWEIIDQGNSSEKSAYSRYDYDPKNAKFDSIEEIRLVAGVEDDVFCRIRDQVTVYATERLNVNAAKTDLIEALVCQLMDPAQRMILCGGGAGIGVAPIRAVGQILDQCRELKSLVFAPLFRNFGDFQGFFQRVGGMMGAMGPMAALGGVSIPIPPQLQQIIGFRGRVIRIEATGEMGSSSKRLSAVIDTRTGKYVYWGER